ncbi:MAG TPA: PDZ domain-containing protein [Aggregatilineales bacterium]|nr:PDZ domain-containing protein [Aggregatilineales bacterium]
MRLAIFLKIGLAIVLGVLTVASTSSLGSSMNSRAMGATVAASATEVSPCALVTPAATLEATAAATMASTIAPTPTVSVLNRGFLGIQAGPVTGCGVIITLVESGGPAEQAGLVNRDVITAIDGVSVSDLLAAPNPVNSASSYASPEVRVFFGQIEKYPAGATVHLTVVRSGKQLDIPVTLGLFIPTPTAVGTKAH